MDYKDFIMSLLEEKGLDKRFRDNPQAVKQICSLIEKESGKPVKYTSEKEIDETVKTMLERYDYVGNDGTRLDNVYSINEDGSFSVKYKTSIDNGLNTRQDSEQIFSIGKERGNFIVSESNDVINKFQDSTVATTSVNFKVFNSNGLEIQSRNISQSVNAYTTNRINNCKDAFNIANSYTGVKYEMGPVEETTLERNENLATVHYRVEESNNSRLLIYEKDRIINNNKNQDIGNPMPMYYSLNGRITGQAKTGEMPNFPPENAPDNLMGYTDYMARVYSEQTDKEREESIQKAYNISASKSEAFRKTLLDGAKTNPKLQEVVEKLGLDRTNNEVKVSDLAGIYKEVDPKECSTVIEQIKETSSKEERTTTNDEIEK